MLPVPDGPRRLAGGASREPLEPRQRRARADGGHQHRAAVRRPERSQHDRRLGPRERGLRDGFGQARIGQERHDANGRSHDGVFGERGRDDGDERRPGAVALADLEPVHQRCQERGDASRLGGPAVIRRHRRRLRPPPGCRKLRRGRSLGLFELHHLRLFELQHVELWRFEVCRFEVRRFVSTSVDGLRRRWRYVRLEGWRKRFDAVNVGGRRAEREQLWRDLRHHLVEREP